MRAAGTRRALATTVHVGHPDAEQVLLPCPDLLDQGLRADLVERALDSLSVLAGACAWLSRQGELGLTDEDAAWFAAARAAFARHGADLEAFFVLNRTGWVDLVSDERRTWVRVRTPPPRSRARR